MEPDLGGEKAVAAGSVDLGLEDTVERGVEGVAEALVLMAGAGVESPSSSSPSSSFAALPKNDLRALSSSISAAYTHRSDRIKARAMHHPPTNRLLSSTNLCEFGFIGFGLELLLSGQQIEDGIHPLTRLLRRLTLCMHATAHNADNAGQSGQGRAHCERALETHFEGVRAIVVTHIEARRTLFARHSVHTRDLIHRNGT
jgi:hypothetical protein